MGLNGEHADTVDSYARERAEVAVETARSAWEGTADISRGLTALRLEVRDGFRSLERKLSTRASRHELEGVQEELEDTKVRNLRKELATLKRRNSAGLKWVMIVAAGVAVAVICGWLGLHPSH